MSYDYEIVIDELKICYKAENEDCLNALKSVDAGECVFVGEYTFYRVINETFRYCFDVVEAGEHVAVFKFWHYTDYDDATCYVYFKIANPILYDEKRLRQLIALPEKFDLVFNNFTAIDLAMDSRLNLPSVIKKMMRNKAIHTIINGKKVDDRKAILRGVSFEYSTSLDRLNHPTITFKQKKAIKNKNDGITVQAYDKQAEIAENSDKQYILEHYGNPKRLYRLEVRLHYRELKDYFRKIRLVPEPHIVFNADVLADMYFYHLSSVIRFTKGRRKVEWQELMKCNGRV